jgi:hypothetical protein
VGGGDGLGAIGEGRGDVEEGADVGVEGDEGQGTQGLEVAEGRVSGRGERSVRKSTGLGF